DAGAKVDQFNDESIGDITFLLRGENRVNDLVSYSSPKIADLVTLNVALQLGENRAASDNTADQEKGLADTFYVSADFESGIFFGTLAYADNERSALNDGTTVGADFIRAAGGVKMPMGLELGALYQTASGIDQVGGAGGLPTAGDLEDKSWLVSAAYTVDAFKFKGQYGKTEGDVSDNSRDMFGLGVDYKLSKALTSQLYYISYKNETGAGVETDADAYGLAMVYSF
ncbi:MAG TPA: porin, partial [Solimonas sp.]